MREVTSYELHTGDKMNLQEIFDQAVGGVIKQGAPSYVDGRCEYRGPNGAKCAVGHLMSDSFYDTKYEGMVIEQLHEFAPEFIETITDDVRAVGMLTFLQSAHDLNANQIPQDFIESFTAKAKQVAAKYNLKWNFENEANQD